MAKRAIDTCLWNNDDIVANFTSEDRYFWVYLLTSPHGNLCGVLKTSSKVIAREMGLHEDTIDNLLNRFENTHRAIFVDKETKEILVLNWYKFNWSKSETVKKGLLGQLESIKSANIKNLVSDRIKLFFDGEQIPNYAQNGDTIYIPYVYGMYTISNPLSVDNKRDRQSLSNIDNFITTYNFSNKIKEIIKKWLKYKTERKNKYTDTGLRTLLNKIQKQISISGEDQVVEDIENCIANGYQGVFFSAPKKKSVSAVNTVRNGYKVE